MKLQFFPDLKSDIAKRRATVGEIREKLRTASVKHGIIHPATLIITLGNETRRFTDHQKAEAYWHRRRLRRGRVPTRFRQESFCTHHFKIKINK